MTQKHLLFDFLWGIVMNFLSCSFECLINLIIRCCIIKGDYSECKKKTFTIMNNSFTISLIELVCGFLIFLIISLISIGKNI